MQLHPDNYYRITVNDKEQRDRIASNGSDNIRFVFQSEKPVVDPTRCLDVDPTMDVESAINAYVRLMGGSEDMVKLGVEYARRSIEI
jgi:hypothetical protein